MSSSLTGILQSLRLLSSAGKDEPLHPYRNAIDSLPSALPQIRLADVAQHDTYKDCWIVIYDRVYDVTRFLLSHPGGEDIIMDHAGRDATIAFHGTGHSKSAIQQMREFLIGELPPNERIFRITNGKIISSGIPD